MEKTIVLSQPHSRKCFDIFRILQAHGVRKKRIVLLVDDDSGFAARRVLKYIYSCRVISWSEFREENPNNFVVLPIEEEVLNLMFKYFPNEVYLNSSYPFKNKLDLGVWMEDEFPDDIPKHFNRVPDIFPVIVKPANGTGSRGIKIVNNSSEWHSKYLNGGYVIQAMMPNAVNVRGVFIYCVRGKIVSYYGHYRHVTYPKSGGVTLLSSIENNEKELFVVRKIVDALSLSGLYMFEFLRDECDKPKLIEINPRIWGSIIADAANSRSIIMDYCNSMDIPFTKTEVTNNSNTFIIWPRSLRLLKLLHPKARYLIVGFDFKMPIRSVINFIYVLCQK